MGPTKASGATHKVHSVHSTESKDEDRSKIYQSMQKTIDAQAKYIVVSNSNRIDEQFSETIGKITNAETFSAFKKKKVHIHLKEGKFCLSVKIGGKDINIMPPDEEVTFSQFDKYRKEISGVVKKYGEFITEQVAEKEYKQEENNLQKISGNTVNQVNNFRNNSMSTTIIDIFCKKTVDEQLEIYEVKGRCSEVHDNMSQRDIDQLFKEQTKSFSDEEMEHKKETAKSGLHEKISRDDSSDNYESYDSSYSINSVLSNIEKTNNSFISFENNLTGSEYSGEQASNTDLKTTAMDIPNPQSIKRRHSETEREENYSRYTNIKKDSEFDKNFHGVSVSKDEDKNNVNAKYPNQITETDPVQKNLNVIQQQQPEAVKVINQPAQTLISPTNYTPDNMTLTPSPTIFLPQSSNPKIDTTSEKVQQPKSLEEDTTSERPAKIDNISLNNIEQLIANVIKRKNNSEEIQDLINLSKEELRECNTNLKSFESLREGAGQVIRMSRRDLKKEVGDFDLPRQYDARQNVAKENIIQLIKEDEVSFNMLIDDIKIIKQQIKKWRLVIDKLEEEQKYKHIVF